MWAGRTLEQNPSKHNQFSQVGRELYSAVRLANDEGRQADVVLEQAATRQRQSAWLGRKNPQSWRPPKRHRVGAHAVLVDVDCQLRDSTSVGGLHTFQIDEDPAKRPDPMDWPLLQMASDRGSDITCATFFMKYEININLDDTGDQSHDIHNDQKGTLSDAKLLSFNLLQCAALNVHHGPWSEDTRFRQVVDGMKDLGQFESPASCPLFGAMARKMLRDTDEEHRIGDPDIEEMLWHRLFDESPWARKGRKIHHNKFLDALENTWMTSFLKGTRLMFKKEEGWCREALLPGRGARLCCLSMACRGGTDMRGQGGLQVGDCSRPRQDEVDRLGRLRHHSLQLISS
jgi:hypothetical protein